MADEFAALIARSGGRARRSGCAGCAAARGGVVGADARRGLDACAIRILHLALTDEVAALAAADPSGFEAYRERAQGGADPFRRNRIMPAAVVAGAVARQSASACWRRCARLDARARITWFGPPMSAMSHATARLMETWAHGQDVVDALGLERAPTARLKHIAHLGVRTRAYSYQQHGLTPPTTDVRVELRRPMAACGRWGEPTAEDRVQGRRPISAWSWSSAATWTTRELVCTGSHAREWLLIAQAFAGHAGRGRRPAQFEVVRSDGGTDWPLSGGMLVARRSTPRNARRPATFVDATAFSPSSSRAATAGARMAYSRIAEAIVVEIAGEARSEG